MKPGFKLSTYSVILGAATSSALLVYLALLITVGALFIVASRDSYATE